MRADRRSLWRTARRCGWPTCVGQSPRWPTMSAPAAGTAAPWLPGRVCKDVGKGGCSRRPAKLGGSGGTRTQREPCSPWRNCRQGCPSPTGLTLEWRDGTLLTERSVAQWRKRSHGPERPSSGAAGGGRSGDGGGWCWFLFSLTLCRACILWAGTRKMRGFRDGPGPGMAQERNPFLPPTTPGQGITVISASVGTT